MPAFSTHYIFLEEMQKPIEEKFDFKLNSKVAGVGTQGPDIFIFHRIWPPFTIYKSLMGVSSTLHHGKTDKLFEAFAEYLKKSENEEVAKSYIYGFILHYALDRNCHPYVYAFQDQITSENKKIHPLAAHNQVEHAIDTYLLYHRDGIYPPSLFNPDETFTKELSEEEEIANVLNYAILNAHGKDVDKNEIIRAINDTASIQKTLSNKNGNALKLAHILETPFGPIDGYFKLSASIKPNDLDIADKYANVRYKEWASPYDKIPRHDSFEELFEKAKPDALNLIDGFNKICKGEKTGYEVTGNISFTTGMEVKD